MLVALVGLLAAGAGLVIAPGAVSVADALVRGIGDVASDHTVPAGARAAIGVGMAAVVVLGVLVALVGASLLLGGLSDLVRPRRVVEGRVLRLRERGDDEHRFWHLAVDDGTAEHVRAWRLDAAPAVHQGETVRARVSPWLGHVSELTPLGDATSVAAPAPVAAEGATAGGAPPALPDAAAVGGALGIPVELAPDALAYPLAVDGASATFVTPDGGRVITSWVRPAELDELRRQPSNAVQSVAGVGDEAYRAPMGGGLVALAGGRVLMVAATLPGMGDQERDRAVDAVARVVAAQAAPG